MKTRNVVYAVAVMLTSAALVACTLEDDVELSEKDMALLGGTPTNERPEVVRVSLAGGCTATMISDRTFLTAAHCIDYNAMRSGGTLTTVNGAAVPIHSTYSQGGQLGTDDIAVGRLTAALPGITPATISATQPSNTWLTVIGYGCTDQRNPPGSGNGCTTDRTFESYFYNGGNTSNYAQGDSGGPTFIGNLLENGPIVRVTSGYTNSGVDIGADAVAFRGHIMALSNALRNSGVSYRSHVQSQGWTPAVANGSTSGTTGQSLRLEGLQVWTQNSGASICYTSHVQGIGWQSEVCNGNLAGTVGQGKRMEAIRIRYQHATAPRTIEYRVYLQGTGWQSWRSNNQTAGTTGESRRIEAIQIRLAS